MEELRPQKSSLSLIYCHGSARGIEHCLNLTPNILELLLPKEAANIDGLFPFLPDFQPSTLRYPRCLIDHAFT